jgi:hypothetical protein
MDSSISENENQVESRALPPGFVLPQCWLQALSGRMDAVKFFR